MDEDWGPWIEHDGKGCPCLGMWAERYGVSKTHFAGMPGVKEITKAGIVVNPLAWDWDNYGLPGPRGLLIPKIIRYRIRRPKALRDLIHMVENLPQPERVDA